MTSTSGRPVDGVSPSCVLDHWRLIDGRILADGVSSMGVFVFIRYLLVLRHLDADDHRPEVVPAGPDHLRDVDDEECNVTEGQDEMLEPGRPYPPSSVVSQASWTGL